MIKLVVTDLDNTIYNWVDFYIPAFNAMVTELHQSTGLDEESLRRSFKRVHEKYHTSEYAFSIEQLDVLPEVKSGLSPEKIRKKYDRAISAFRHVRKEKLRLYDGVRETLIELRNQGKRIVGHSDALMFYALSRLKQLNAEDLFDGLIAARDHGVPAIYTNGNAVNCWTDFYQSSIPYRIELPPRIFKPDARCITSLLRDFAIQPCEAIYIGDSVTKDVYMAQRCGAYDVYAEYGRRVDRKNYRELVEISHWTAKEVAYENGLGAVNIKPTFTISRFADVLNVVAEIEEREIVSRGCAAAAVS